jgi:5'-methylthioadenosine phosphorylase
MRKAIIGGTGIYGLNSEVEQKTVETIYGAVECDLIRVADQEIVFLARHGKGHSAPPHKINYRANMMALKQLEVEEIYATCAVGSMNPAFEPGDVVVINDFLDFTKSRVQTFYEGGDTKVAHVEMTQPYCPNLIDRFKNAVSLTNMTFKGEAVYVCTEGPRFETAAEIRMFQKLGGDVVGMTNVPESVLAKELGMCYSALGIITNWCTGVEGVQIEGHVIDEAMGKNKESLTQLFIKLLTQGSSDIKCHCDQSLIIL